MQDYFIFLADLSKKAAIYNVCQLLGKYSPFSLLLRFLSNIVITLLQ